MEQVEFRYEPQAIKDLLSLGNDAYVRGVVTDRRAASLLRTRLAQDGQHPYAVVVTCCDSRVQPIDAFSAQLGDLFVVRTIGAYVGPVESASVEYGVAGLGAPLVVVLGHTQCGAIRAAIDGSASGMVRLVTDDIAACLDGQDDAPQATCRAVGHSIERILDNPTIAGLVREGKVEVCGAIYDIETGVVMWL